MAAQVRDSLDRDLDDVDLAPLMSFFDSAGGRQIVALEIAAREAMIAPEVEQMAREHHAALRAERHPRIDLIDSYIETNGLIDGNVSGALNASLQFYGGLVDGGAMRLTEAEILDEVRASAPEVREDIADWVPAFLLMAYQPVDTADIRAYIDLSRTAEGAALNAALFSAYNAMYDDISYRLGRAVAQEMQTEDL